VHQALGDRSGVSVTQPRLSLVVCLAQARWIWRWPDSRDY